MYFIVTFFLLHHKFSSKYENIPSSDLFVKEKNKSLKSILKNFDKV